MHAADVVRLHVTREFSVITMGSAFYNARSRRRTFAFYTRILGDLYGSADLFVVKLNGYASAATSKGVV